MILSRFFPIILILVSQTTLLHAQWNQILSSPSGPIYDIIESNGVLYSAQYGNGVYKSTDSTVTWVLISNGLLTIQAKKVSQLLADGTVLYAATVDGIYKSTNDGENWVKKSNGITIGPGAVYEFTESIFKNDSVLFTGAWNGIYRSTDDAENWEITNISGSGLSPRYFINHNNILFAARENINQPYGYKSTDSGNSWEDLTSISIPTITFLSESGKLWAGTIHGVWLSTDNGASWEMRNNGLNPDPYSSSIIRINGSLITSLKFGGSGMFKSSNDGVNWESWDDGLPFLNSIEKLIKYDNKIIAATSNGLWERDTSEVVTTLDDEISSAVNFELFPNYPNPFNPTTTIQYSIPEAGNVKLKIYNSLGEQVATLADDFKKAGNYQINFDASNFSSGIYFYQLVSDGFTKVRKMILIK